MAYRGLARTQRERRGARQPGHRKSGVEPNRQAHTGGQQFGGVAPSVSRKARTLSRRTQRALERKRGGTKAA